MGRIVVTEFVSLDGVMEAPGGGEDYKHAGWTFEIEQGDEGRRFKLEETLDSDALLLGRVTYEGFAAAWPSMEGEFADRFNAMPKYVVSSTLESPEWTNSTVLDGDLVEEMRLMVFPVVLGSGKRLFGDMADKRRLRLAASTTIGDGIALLTYERA